MAHGPDTYELLRRIRDCDGITLDISSLHITSLPELPSSLLHLGCNQTAITRLPDLPPTLLTLELKINPILKSLPTLPPSLKKLDCWATSITSLPELPSTLKSLDCNRTHIAALPELPSSLEELYCNNTRITTLPELPSTLKTLECNNTLLVLQRKKGESIHDYNLRWREWKSMSRIQAKHRLLKEEIVMAAWHPRRVQKWIDLDIELDTL